MIKRIIITFLAALCLTAGFITYAADTEQEQSSGQEASESADSATQQNDQTNQPPEARPQPGGRGGMNGRMPGTQTANGTEQPDDTFPTPPEGGNRGFPPGEMPQDGTMPGGNRGSFNGNPGQMQNTPSASTTTDTTAEATFPKDYTSPIISMLLLGLAFVFVIFYRRKSF